MKITSSTIENKFIKIKTLDIGASLFEVYLKSKKTNLILNLGSKKNYIVKNGCVGATCGRFAGRISGAKFSIDREKFLLSKNEGDSTLHGGKKGFDKYVWRKINHKKNKIIYMLKSKHLDQGFPGNLTTYCSYHICRKDLIIRYEYFSDRKTHVNLTNHSYWNLNKNKKYNIFNHDLKINSNKYLEVNKKLIPTGKIKSTKNTIYDFEKFSNLNEKIKKLSKNYYQKGFDLTYMVKKTPNEYIATLQNKLNKIKIDIFSDLPALTLYTAQHLNFKKKLYPFDGICLETEFCPDTPNQKKFPSTLIKPNKRYAFYTKIKIN